MHTTTTTTTTTTADNNNNNNKDLEKEQTKELLDKIAHYIPILNCVFQKNYNINPIRIKEYVLREKKERRKKKILKKCFKCGETKGKLYLKQISSLSRCSDELIETHHLCEKCL